MTRSKFGKGSRRPASKACGALEGVGALAVLVALVCLGIERISPSSVSFPVPLCVPLVLLSPPADADPLAFDVSVGPFFVKPWQLITAPEETPSPQLCFNAPDLSILAQALIEVVQEGGSRHPHDSAKPEGQKSPHHHLMLLSSASTRHTTTLSSAILLLTFITH